MTSTRMSRASCGAWGYSRTQGAKHEKWEHPNGHVTIVPRKIRSRHTANGILKDCASSKRL
jgi:predicted RNA binding protein YcfA (HicA-like mRNA interferase family)